MKQKTLSLRNISCSEAVKRMFGYIDDRLEGRSRGELEHHLETCRHCFDRVEFERLLKSRLGKLKISEKSEVLQKRIEALLEKF